MNTVDLVQQLQDAHARGDAPTFVKLVNLLSLAITPDNEHRPQGSFEPFGGWAPAKHNPPAILDPHLVHIEHLLVQVLVFLSAIHAQNRRLLMNAADLNATLDRVNEATNNIAADIRTLVSQIGVGMTQAEVDALGARLLATADTLDAIAAETPDAPPVVPDGGTLSNETGAGTQGRA